MEGYESRVARLTGRQPEPNPSMPPHIAFGRINASTQRGTGSDVAAFHQRRILLVSIYSFSSPVRRIPSLLPKRHDWQSPAEHFVCHWVICSIVPIFDVLL